jgi:hypothetical protein
VGLDAELGAEGKIEVGGLGDDGEKFLFRKIVLFFCNAMELRDIFAFLFEQCMVLCRVEVRSRRHTLGRCSLHLERYSLTAVML